MRADVGKALMQQEKFRVLAFRLAALSLASWDGASLAPLMDALYKRVRLDPQEVATLLRLGHKYLPQVVDALFITVGHEIP